MNLDRFPSPDVGCAPEMTPRAEREAAEAQFEHNSACDYAETKIDWLVEELKRQAKGHAGDWSEMFNALDYARSMVPEKV
jgi:hypothetical protein